MCLSSSDQNSLSNLPGEAVPDDDSEISEQMTHSENQAEGEINEEAEILNQTLK